MGIDGPALTRHRLRDVLRIYFVSRGAYAGLSRTVPDLIRDPVLVSPRVTFYEL